MDLFKWIGRVVSCGLVLSICVCSCRSADIDSYGYPAEEAYQYDAVDTSDTNVTCPTDRLLKTRQQCLVDNELIDCLKLHCCDHYVYIAGRCIHESEDPCALQLCEQSCAVRERRVWCTCYAGFEYSPENYKKGKRPHCIDVNECSRDNGGCAQRCVNDAGSYHCECAAEYALAEDARTCRPLKLEAQALQRPPSRCFTSCETTGRLNHKIKLLHEQVHALQTALKQLVDRPPARGGSERSERYTDGALSYQVLDATAPLEGGRCRCERGPRGPPGAPGMEGPKGDAGPTGARGAKGPRGSFDLLLLLLADLRHDIYNLESRVYRDGEQPERFNLRKAWRKQKTREKGERDTNIQEENTLEAYTAPPVQRDNVEITPNGLNGEIGHEATTDGAWNDIKQSPDADTYDVNGLLNINQAEYDEELIASKLRELHLLANSTADNTEEEESEDDFDYSFV